MCKDIVIIGAGGVAESFVNAFVNAGVSPRVIMSPTEGNAERLVNRYTPQTKALHKFSELPTNADIYLFCVPDKKIGECAKQMPITDGVWLHTAACVSLEALTDCHKDSAVFYPLQTFTKGRPIPISTVPLFYEAKTEKAERFLLVLASLFSMNARASLLEERKRIHLAAVFACNFVNHQWNIASQILTEKEIPTGSLLPLMEETFQKAKAIGAENAQTGPAYRGDKNTQKAHLELLIDMPEEWKQVYQIMSESIEHTRTIEKHKG